ncbi:TlpA family protein disulfide reductase [bacterium]|nr:TlpA family protein disulfide reductase [bacterium]
MRTVTLSLMVLLLATMATFAVTLEEFQAQWQEADGKEAKIELTRQALAQIEDLDLIRKIQDKWVDYDRASAMEYFTERLAGEESATNLYLMGRLQTTPVAKIEYARRAITADPMFIYGYRLLAVPYMNNLFDAEEGDEHYAELAASFPIDYPLLKAATEKLPDDGDAWQFLYEAQVYQKDYAAQLETLKRGKEMDARWAGTQGFVNAYVGMGDFELAQEQAAVLVDERIANGRLEPEYRDDMIFYRYSNALDATNSLDEAVRYFSSLEGELAATARVYLAATWVRKGSEKKAWKALNEAIELGYDTPGELHGVEELEPLHGTKKWEKALKAVKQNRIDSAPERRAEALADKMDLAAPALPMVGVNGEAVTLADLRGKVVIIDFWATWCGPCRMAMPEINEFTRDYADKDVVVISLNVWEDAAEKAKKFMVEKDYAMELMWATGDEQPTDLFEVTGIPTLVVIDKEGVIRFKEVGYEEGLREKLGWFADNLL